MRIIPLKIFIFIIFGDNLNFQFHLFLEIQFDGVVVAEAVTVLIEREVFFVTPIFNIEFEEEMWYFFKVAYEIDAKVT